MNVPQAEAQFYLESCEGKRYPLRPGARGLKGWIRHCLFLHRQYRAGPQYVHQPDATNRGDCVPVPGMFPISRNHSSRMQGIVNTAALEYTAPPMATFEGDTTGVGNNLNQMQFAQGEEVSMVSTPRPSCSANVTLHRSGGSGTLGLLHGHALS